MTAREFLTNITVILTVMAVGALLETVVPMLAAKPWKQDRRAANLGLTALSFGSNWLLSSIAAAAALSLRPAGLLARLGWPLWIETLAGIVVLDFSVGYLSHRAMHMWPVMWRFHQIHHSDPFVDVTTTYRTHPVETVWRFLFAIVPVWLLGIPAQAVVVQRLLQATNGIIEHANIRLWGAPRPCAVPGVGDPQCAQDSPFARGLGNQLKLREPADGVRPPAWHLHAGRAGGVSEIWARRGERDDNRVVSRSAVDAVSGSRASDRT
jgi:hypothetical protein